MRVRLPAETGSTGHTATNRGVLTPRSACWRTRKVYAVRAETINPAFADVATLDLIRGSLTDQRLLNAVSKGLTGDRTRSLTHTVRNLLHHGRQPQKS